MADQNIPDPHPEFRGAHQTPSRENLARKANQWSPRGSWLLRPFAVLAAYAHRVIDRSTGKAYSADELLTTHPRSVKFNSAITSQTGGLSNHLDSIPTVPLPIGTVQIVALSASIIAFYQLISGTTAESSPEVIRPDDFDATTNQKVWKLAGIQGDVAFLGNRLQVNTGYLQMVGDNGGSVDVYGQDDGDDGTLTLPSVTGTVAAVPAYADDAAAGTGGLASGEFFWNTTTKKLVAKS